MDKKAIKRNFSRFALVYDDYAQAQRICALKLLSHLDHSPFQNILDIGCGTGSYSYLLRKKFVHARLKAVDISDSMIAVAKDKLKGEKIEFIVGDAEIMDLGRDFDLITSNACFQWFDNLEKALKRYRKMLKKGGSISFSTFGPGTFLELNLSLQSLSKNACVCADNFITKENLTAILKRNFKDVSVDELIYEEEFCCLADLLKKIKYTGTNGMDSGSKISFNQRRLKELEAAYLHRFNQIKATYQIFFCHAKKI